MDARALGLIISTLCACGRVGFVARTGDADGAPTSDAARAVPALVASRSAFVSSGSVVTVTVPAIASGHLVVVGVATYNAGTSVQTIGDDVSNAYVSAGQRATYTTAGTGSSEIWFAIASAAGATTITTTLAGSSGGAVWIAELSGIDATSPLDGGAVVDDQPYSGSVAGPSVSTSTPNELVVAVEQAVGAATGTSAGNAFAALPPTNGDDAAYEIASAPGSYRAVWDVAGNGGSCASAAVFAAAPL